ncbi:hypothetical protein L083_1783 [Actinoplanes sp. N902-109]|nr:hypothetical protein L083_1783 [Actinoplanes sp. N902-109]
MPRPRPRWTGPSAGNGHNDQMRRTARGHAGGSKLGRPYGNERHSIERRPTFARCGPAGADRPARTRP